MKNTELLLTRAAEAAGCISCWWVKNPSWDEDDYGFLADFGEGQKSWMPLENNGDAFWLAGKMGYLLDFTDRSVNGIYFQTGDDVHAAMRLAIVQAAADSVGPYEGEPPY